MIEHLNLYSPFITAASTVVLALITIMLWLENRRLRQVGLAPQLVAYLEPANEGNGAIEFVLANIGRGPAFDVSLNLTYDLDDFLNHQVFFENDEGRSPFNVIPQDTKIRSLFGISYVLYGRGKNKDESPLKPFTFSIEYKDAFGRKSRTNGKIDIRQFAGLRGLLRKPNDAKIVKELEGIRTSLEELSGQSAASTSLVDSTSLEDAYVQKNKGGWATDQL